MERICQFLKEAGVYYLATVEGDQPRVRPFGTAHIFEGKLYIQTGKVKPVSKQISANPKVEISAFKDGEKIDSIRVMSIGGGDISIVGEKSHPLPNIYPHTTFSEIKKYCIEKNISLFEYIEEIEPKETFKYLFHFVTSICFHFYHPPVSSSGK